MVLCVFSQQLFDQLPKNVVSLTPIYCFFVYQGAKCGEGVRFRNVSCFVSDGSGQQDGSLVEDELCADIEPSVDGDAHIVLKEICIVPCPGRSLTVTLHLVFDL